MNGPFTAFVAWLYQSGTLRMVGRTVPLRSVQSLSPADVLEPADRTTPGPSPLPPNRFGPGQEIHRAPRTVQPDGQVRALPRTHWSQPMFQSPYPSWGASWVLVPVTWTMSP